ncbi:MAG TPA: biotin--[acetyl-CoA-carboxylase] ligase [Woeseiaceae bacterium]|jgi:BirA family biotin operon repressor/biotin-[acetyl-CoA-carboxylase] ligase|nr:biotin--[acetyl-CoA-carboxylase] ligase [Woeseiaceae bacterium]
MALSASDILRLLTDTERACLDQIEAFESIDSTNTHLLEQPAPRAGQFRAAIADYQTQGRGRYGRRWIAPPGAALCLSVAGTFGDPPGNLPSLTLAMGVSVAAALRTLGVGDVALKWPNDVVACDGKLGGILTEVSRRGPSGCTVVVGLGLNIDLPPAMIDAPEGRWASKITDLKGCVDALPSNAQLGTGLLQCMLATFTRFESDGFAAFCDAWRDYDWLKGRHVSVPQAEDTVEGRAKGIDADGALLVETTEGTRHIFTGSVTIVE